MICVWSWWKCKVGSIMDELWVKHSNGLFGFSVQKTIWINLGGTPGVYNYDIRSQFNTKVEWTRLAA